MPYPFLRQPSEGSADIPFGMTSVSNNTSFSQVSGADFLVFDQQLGLELLGPTPTYEYVFNAGRGDHEAPVWVPSQNKLYLSNLLPGYVPHQVIDLNQDPPTLGTFLSDPPVYATEGGTFHDGLVYWAVSGSTASINGTEQRPGIAVLDPVTNKATTLLNNYFGYYFNSVDDLFVDSKGDIWFTDPDYSWFSLLSDSLPQLAPATYRFRPSTGAVSIVESSLVQPNGIAISPDETTIYICDSGAENGNTTAGQPHLGAPYTNTGPRAIYKYDVIDNGTAIGNKRPFYLPIDWIPDGLKVARNGYVVTATGQGVDVLDEFGTLLVRVQTNYTVENFAWTGANYTDLWMVGQGGISKVTWALQGQALV
ncbi:MAG: hypothetical protein M1827_007616 [Pycnora praestabilis]|nr:MAG: hypothetical protein M1827_007616 [Pycnora praestabilis]